MHRRTFVTTSLGALGAGALSPLTASAQDRAPSLLDMARDMAGKPYEAPQGELSAPFADLDYDAYRAIRPLPGQAAFLPLGDRYAVDLLPPGLYFPDPIKIEFVRRGGVVETLPFSPDLFSYDPAYFDSIPEESPGAGFTGLRLRTNLNKPDVQDEFFVMQGGTYFRAIGRDMTYGLSTRAIALGTGEAEPEEFPRFTIVRLHTPAEDGIVRFEALIDSASLTGYMDLYANAGDQTRTRVQVTVFPRKTIPNAGFAALTSMYLKGPMRAAVSDDFRPRVHDTDVLMIENGAGEALWRPISNPAAIQTSAFSDEMPKAFGLYQTDRDFDDFEDAEAFYHKRPSARIEPRGDWGPGEVQLVELPTDTEFMDNIVSYWRPAEPLEPGRSYTYDYDVVWTVAPPPQDFPVRIGQSRSGRKHDEPGTRIFVIDLRGDPRGLMPELIANAGETTEVVIHPLPDGQQHRVTFNLKPGDADAVELRLALRDREGNLAAPIWLHRWTRARDGQV
ncbi:glucan biosynthesis protein [Roseivivax sediminis]|uniref:Glucans biosynthesis protein n=1 Tax=Roseivivax sediminis TaxID=936889 RepID=A0A1I1UCK2_9RHOB|nr:glucan biosynthesis protein [Roseivivax sediminis]SFD68414.1 glucans biosynthesis protein [Roseivivax sediminis]